jgi:hypothetical protein
VRSPSEGLLDFPVPMASGRMMKREDRTGRVDVTIVFQAARHHRDVRFRLGFVIEADGPFRAHFPARSARGDQGPGAHPHGGV